LQTWEDPNQQHAETKARGDNDPLDVCEIGEQVGYVGQVKQVKVLGIMALLDEGETDWKVVVVDVQDPLASKLNDIEDVERHLPGLVRATNEWVLCESFVFPPPPPPPPLPILNLILRISGSIYKIPDGKPENQFAFSGEAKNKKYAAEIIHECHEAWRRLAYGESPAKTPNYELSMCAVSGRHQGFELTLVQSQRISRELPWTRQAERPRIHKLASRLEEASSGSYRPC
jgi:inorganic pyrophosphatase